MLTCIRDSLDIVPLELELSITQALLSPKVSNSRGPILWAIWVIRDGSAGKCGNPGNEESITCYFH